MSMYDMSPTDYHAASDPTPVSIGKLSTKELHEIIGWSDDQELLDAAAEELNMRILSSLRDRQLLERSTSDYE